MSVMGLFNKSGRTERYYTKDFPEMEVHPKDCVPDERPYGTWTFGTKAWLKGEQGASDEWIGWFTPPRLRQKKPKW